MGEHSGLGFPSLLLYSLLVKARGDGVREQNGALKLISGRSEAPASTLAVILLSDSSCPGILLQLRISEDCRVRETTEDPWKSHNYIGQL